jgi:hypothetical protein
MEQALRNNIVGDRNAGYDFTAEMPGRREEGAEGTEWPVDRLQNYYERRARELIS